MAYFDQFPQVLMMVQRKPTIVTDIFRRLAVGSRFNDVSAVLLPYFVTDGETPEMVSNKLYRTPFYHWVILYANNIVDPRQEWPLEDRFVTPLVFEKYDFTVLVDSVLNYQVGDTLTSSDGGSFIVMQITPTTIQLRSTVGQTFLTYSSILTITTPGRERTGLHINQITDPSETIHHYVDQSNGYIVDYSTTNTNLIAVSNYEYEQKINDDKRTVRVLDPQYLGSFVRSFEQLVSV